MGPKSYFTNVYFLLGLPSSSSHINPGATFVYTWDIPRDVGPTATDPNCLTWFYYSSVNPPKDTNSGLVGPLLVCRNGSLGEDGKQVSRGTYVPLRLAERWLESELWGKGKWQKAASPFVCGVFQFHSLLCSVTVSPSAP